MSLGRGEACSSATDDKAGGQALEVPFPGTGKRFVKVVDVEHEAPLRGRKYAEVGEVGVAAQLHLDTGCRGALEVGRHDGGRATIEGERGR